MANAVLEDELRGGINYNTSLTFWNDCIEKFNDLQFKKNFRVTRNTFDIICDRIGQDINSNDIRSINILSVQIKVGVTLWRLATNLEYRSIAQIFCMSIQSAVYWTNKVT